MTTEASKPVIVVGADSFKGSLTAYEATREMARGVIDVLGDRAEILAVPLADGGEGTLEVLQRAWNGTYRSVEVTDAIGRPITARYALDADCSVAVIEAAEANGLPAVADVPLQPLRADSYGVGLLVRHALALGVSELLLCIGGSATTDGGTGLMRALGVRFLDEAGREVEPGGAGLSQIRTIDNAGLIPAARLARWRIAVDVTNPLLGENGAAAVFGPQKGATAEDIAVLDAGLASFANIVSEHLPGDGTRAGDRPGLGAAGGLAYAPAVYLGAELVSGADLVSSAIDLPATIERADLVITGEGSFDSQSLHGKVVDLVRRTASAATPVVVIAGRVALSAAECRGAGITAAFSIAQGAAGLNELTEQAEALVRDAAAHVTSLYMARESSGAGEG